MYQVIPQPDSPPFDKMRCIVIVQHAISPGFCAIRFSFFIGRTHSPVAMYFHRASGRALRLAFFDASNSSCAHFGCTANDFVGMF